jgi:RNA polymerase sigma-70 factor (ECF subfamily)
MVSFASTYDDLHIKEACPVARLGLARKAERKEQMLQQQQEGTAWLWSKASDHDVVNYVLTGNQRAFEVLVDRYHDPLFRYSQRLLHDHEQTEDVLQFVFLQLYLALPTMIVQKPLKAWLFRVAYNRCIDELRRRRRTRLVAFSTLEQEGENEENSFLESIADPCPLPEEVVIQSDVHHHLKQALETLSPKHRAIISLYYFKQLTFAEIGIILHMPTSTVKTYCYRSLPKLRALLLMQTDVHLASQTFSHNVIQLTNTSVDLSAALFQKEHLS